MLRQVAGAESARGQGPPVVHVGLANAAVADEVRIFWPGGTTTVLTDVAANQILKVVEGSGVTELR